MSANRIATTLLLQAMCLVATAQQPEDGGDGVYKGPFAVVVDPDGWANVREGGKVTDRIYEDVVFAVPSWEEPVDGSAYIEYWNRPATGEIIRLDLCAPQAGYMHLSRIKYLYDLQRLEKSVEDGLMTFTGDGARVEIRTGTTAVGDHDAMWDSEGYPIEIDGYRPYGFDGIAPESMSELRSITCIVDGKSHEFDPEWLYGYFSICPDNAYVARGKGDTLFICMMNGDGAGGYNLVWTVRGGKPESSVVFIDF